MRHETVTIVVIAGQSLGLKHELTNPRTTIGRVGGGADIQIDDPQASALNTVVSVSKEMVRLYDLDSPGGTFLEDERVEAAGLQHFSEFRIGSTVFMVTIVPTSVMAAN